jgi:hypothetical protein
MTTEEFLALDLGQICAQSCHKKAIYYYLRHYLEIKEQSIKNFRIVVEAERKNIKYNSTDATVRYQIYVDQMKQFCREVEVYILSITETVTPTELEMVLTTCPIANSMVDDGLNPQDVLLIQDILMTYHWKTKQAIAQCELERLLQNGRYDPDFRKNW